MEREPHGEHLSVAKALYQLDFYLKTLELPVTIHDLYARAYQGRRGESYDDRWLNHLADNPEVAESLDEPFTSHTIVEVLMKTGHEPIIRALMREIRRNQIGFTHAYMIGSHRRR
jgi:hypothetical protein